MVRKEGSFADGCMQEMYFCTECIGYIVDIFKEGYDDFKSIFLNKN